MTTLNMQPQPHRVVAEPGESGIMEGWTVPQLARWWGVDKSKIYHWINQQVVPVSRSARHTSPKIFINVTHACRAIVAAPALFHSLHELGRERIQAHLAGLATHTETDMGKSSSSQILEYQRSLQALKDAISKVASESFPGTHRLLNGLISALYLQHHIQLLSTFDQGTEFQKRCALDQLIDHRSDIRRHLGNAADWDFASPVGKALARIYLTDFQAIRKLI